MYYGYKLKGMDLGTIWADEAFYSGVVAEISFQNSLSLVPKTKILEAKPEGKSRVPTLHSQDVA